MCVCSFVQFVDVLVIFFVVHHPSRYIYLSFIYLPLFSSLLRACANNCYVSAQVRAPPVRTSSTDGDDDDAEVVEVRWVNFASGGKVCLVRGDVYELQGALLKAGISKGLWGE